MAGVIFTPIHLTNTYTHTYAHTRTHTRIHTHTHTHTRTHTHSIVQGADWHWGPTRTANITDTTSGQDAYVKDAALATCVLSLVFLIGYLVFQVVYSVGSKRKEQIRRQEE